MEDMTEVLISHDVDDIYVPCEYFHSKVSFRQIKLMKWLKMTITPKKQKIFLVLTFQVF